MAFPECPFGKYKGQRFQDIPPDYLAWVARWIQEDSGRTMKFKHLVEFIRRFFAQ